MIGIRMPKSQFYLPTIFCHDNLPVLEGIDSETIDLIYLDPPFNKNEDFNRPLDKKFKEEIVEFLNDFNVFNAQHGGEICDEILKWRDDYAQPSFEDTWDSDDNVRQGLDWIAKIIDEQKDCIVSYLEGLGLLANKKCIAKGYLSYIAFMAVRLIEMKRILKPTGSIYLHCDSTMSHHIKMLMDMIFGEPNFRNEIIWKRTNNPKGSQYKAKKYGIMTDTIFYYVKSDRGFFDIDAAKNPLSAKELKEKYHEQDELGRFYEGPIVRSESMGVRPNLTYAYKGFTPTWGWRMEKDKLMALDKAGDLGWREKGTPYRKLRAKQDKGHPIYNLWDDISRVQGHEWTGYPTQKPIKLLERIIQASSKEGDLVLDPFCGCATTCIAAHKLKRRYIGIDISKAAYVITIYRIFKEEFGWASGNLITNDEKITTYKRVVPRFTNQTPERDVKEPLPKKKYIYLISNHKLMPGELKVGQSNNPERRKGGYDTGDSSRGYKLEFMEEYTNYNEVEKRTLAHFPRAKGEWIKAEVQEVKDFIKSIGKTKA